MCSGLVTSDTVESALANIEPAGGRFGWGKQGLEVQNAEHRTQEKSENQFTAFVIARPKGPRQSRDRFTQLTVRDDKPQTSNLYFPIS